MMPERTRTVRFRLSLLPALLAVSCALILNAPAHGESYPELPDVTYHKLPNGLQVLIAPSSASDLETIDVWVGAGTRRETPENNGAAHFIEHLLFKGTPTRQPGEIDAAIEDLGGSLNAATSYDWAHFYVTVESSDTEAALGIMADVIRNAELRQQDMEQERPVILSEMARNFASPFERLTRTVDGMVFGDNPYGRPLLGTEDNVAQMKRDTVLDFYHTYYVPENVTVVLSGNVPPDTGYAMAQKAFGSWAAKPLPSDKTLVPPRMHSITTRSSTAGVGRGYLVIGFNAPSVKNVPDAYAMDVLLTLLGQGGNDRLETDLMRREKLVSAITADYLTQHDPGVLTIKASFQPQDLDRVLAGILDEIRSLRDTPISAEDLAAAKHALLASYLFDVQTTSGRANALGFYNTIDSYQYDTNYIHHFESVTAADVQAVAQKYLDPNAYALATMLPRPDPETASISGSR
jgi:predicted Zn-dependent peptidase